MKLAIPRCCEPRRRDSIAAELSHTIEGAAPSVLHCAAAAWGSLQNVGTARLDQTKSGDPTGDCRFASGPSSELTCFRLSLRGCPKMMCRSVWFALLAAVLLGCDASSPEIGPVKVDPNAPPVKPMMGGGAPMSDEAKAKMAEGYQKYAPPNERERLAKEKAESEGAAKATGDEPAGEAQETEPAPESTETPAATSESETPPKE